MFFVFSKLLLIFILPFTWFACCFFAFIFVKKPKLKRRLLIASVVLLLIFSSPFLLNRFAGSWDVAPVPLKTTGAYSCVIVLGGFSSEGPNGSGYFNATCDRFIEGLKLLKTGKASHILITGGNGGLVQDSFRESDWVKTQLQQFRVPDSLILIENQSRNTIENAAFSKRVLDSAHLQPPYILVTSAFHMRRSLGIFQHTRIPVIPYPCNYLTGHGKLAIDELIPDAGPLFIWNIYIKELVGTAVNHLKW